jgi:hypothetical protein
VGIQVVEMLTLIGGLCCVGFLVDSVGGVAGAGNRLALSNGPTRVGSS